MIVFHRAAVVGVLLLLAAPALADDRFPDPAHSYQVVNVASNDVLNVRRGAGATNPIVATLRPNQKGVVITGVTQPVGSSHWWQIVVSTTERGTGWVNGRFLSVDSSVTRQAGFDLVCAGTEPFWGLRIAGGQARLSQMGEQQPPWNVGGWMNAAGFQSAHRFAIRLMRGEGAIGWAMITRPRQPCSDGMSDLSHPYEGMIVTPGDSNVFAGCCSRAR